MLFSTVILCTDQLLLPLPPLEPDFPAAWCGHLVFRWERNLNGLPETDWDPFLCFLVTIPGPDPANHLVLEESHLPDTTLSFPQNLPCPPALKYLLSWNV